jgi:hypothetical protein
MPTKKTPTTRRSARKPLADNWARNAAVAAHDQIIMLKVRIAKAEEYAKRIERLVDDHLAGLV